MLFHFEKDSDNYPNSTFLLHAPLIFTHIMHIYTEYASKQFYTKRNIPNITQTKFQSILTIRRGFSKVWFFVSPSTQWDFLPNISRSTSNQTMKFGQSMEYKHFPEKSYTKCGGETSRISFTGKIG